MSLLTKREEYTPEKLFQRIIVRMVLWQFIAAFLIASVLFTRINLLLDPARWVDQMETTRQTLMSTIALALIFGTLLAIYSRRCLLLLSESYRLALQSYRDQTRELKDVVKIREEFISIASHELRTPVTSVQLQTQALMRMIEQNQSIEPMALKLLLSNLKKQIARLNALIDDMLDIRRLSNGKLHLSPNDFNLSELLNVLTTDFSETYRAMGGETHTQIESGIMVHLDFARIEQVISSLLSNALKYGNRKLVEVGLNRSPFGGLEITVEDHGIGISTSDQTRIFDRFERAISATQISGFGLGLYISRQIVQAHRGEILVMSSPGNGSTFLVRLPLIMAEEDVFFQAA